MLRIKNIKINVNKEHLLINKISNKLKINSNDIKNYKIIKRSIDARDKKDILYVYELDVDVINENKILKRNIRDVSISKEEKYEINNTGTIKLNNRPIIIGSGPAGLFTAYQLAILGYKPIIIERGEDVDSRVKTVENFFKTNKLNINSNIQFGEGGAGTFSDGKLNTLTKDKENRCKKVFEIFVENGANEDILYDYKPHIGTDLLRIVIKNMRNKIISYGGEFRYNTKLTDLIIENNKIKKIIVNDNEEIETDILILAIGHSARDTFEMLYKNNLIMHSKPFAVGFRVIHPQEMINKSQFGDYSKLYPASYKLTCNVGDKGIYSFCMCPGGYVVNASSEENRLVVNGMSNHARESTCANSAIIITVNEKDYGNDLFDGIKFQRKIEENAYRLGKGLIPVQTFKDFKDNKNTTSLEFIPMIKGEFTLSNLNEILPNNLNQSLIEGIEYFGTKIKGFNNDNTILCGVESRTSSPIRINRDDNLESNIKGIYPIGEGAGYAGGITTSAIDGLKVVEKIVSKYKNNLEEGEIKWKTK